MSLHIRFIAEKYKGTIPCHSPMVLISDILLNCNETRLVNSNESGMDMASRAQTDRSVLRGPTLKNLLMQMLIDFPSSNF